MNTFTIYVWRKPEAYEVRKIEADFYFIDPSGSIQFGMKEKDVQVYAVAAGMWHTVEIV